MRVAMIALALTWAFFWEYIPPTKRIHLWSDIEGYHLPLLHFANKSLWSGKFPLWEPSMYCGLPFAANVQAGLFYPPNWLLFLASRQMPDSLTQLSHAPPGAGMRFTAVEILAFLHVWLAFLFAWLWLRERTSRWLPPVLGGAVVAVGGYMLSQMNHLGVICGYAWMPLALWGIEQASARREWKPLWKVSVAAAMCVLAGYPPTAVGLATVCLIYAALLPGRLRLTALTFCALAFTAVLCAVQLLPAMQLTLRKHADVGFGGALPWGSGFYWTMLLPNWFDQNRTTAGPEAAAGDYLYLGLPFLFALVWLAYRRRLCRGAGISLTMLAVLWFIAADPTGAILRLAESSALLGDLLRRFSFLPGMVLAAALLAASALDDAMHIQPAQRAVSHRRALAWATATLLWSAHLLVTSRFAVGLQSAVYPTVALLLLFVGVHMIRYSGPRTVLWSSVAILALVICDYQAFGTNRRFNAVDGSVDKFYRGDRRVGGKSMIGLDPNVYEEILRHPEYRVALVNGPSPTDLRYYGLSTPQGSDPFLAEEYRKAVEQFVPFQTNREFEIDPFNETALRFFGIRYVFTVDHTPVQAALEADPRYRKMQPATSFFTIFEYLHAQPAWRVTIGEATVVRWDAAHRSFELDMKAGGELVLLEQYFPGWAATVDGHPAAVRVTDRVFQAVSVPAGRHRVDFVYVPAGLYTGAATSAAGWSALLIFGVFCSIRHRRGERGARPAGAAATNRVPVC